MAQGEIDRSIDGRFLKNVVVISPQACMPPPFSFSIFHVSVKEWWLLKLSDILADHSVVQVQGTGSGYHNNHPSNTVTLPVER